MNHQRLVCWPFKYTFTFKPRIADTEQLKPSVGHSVDMDYDEAQSVGDGEGLKGGAMLLDG